MSYFADIFEKMKKSGFFIILGILTFYFVINTIKGDRGFFKYLYLKNKVEVAKQNRMKYAEQKKDLQKKVAMLSENSLDLDYLEERARIVLNMVGNDEYIIVDKDIDKQ